MTVTVTQLDRDAAGDYIAREYGTATDVYVSTMSGDADETELVQAFARHRTPGWRPEVIAFANLMEQQLRANDHKPGWKRDSPTALWRRLVQEAEELSQEIIGIDPDKIDRPQTAKEAVDVANFAMMIADVCGALPSTEYEGDAPEGIGQS